MDLQFSYSRTPKRPNNNIYIYALLLVSLVITIVLGIVNNKYVLVPVLFGVGVWLGALIQRS